MIILGISAFFHDSSVALVVDGKVVAGALEERFSRVKHDKEFPLQACQYCLKYAGISLSEVDIVVFYEKPFQKFERILKTHIQNAPRSLSMFLKSMPIWLKERLNMRRTIRHKLEKEFGYFSASIRFVDHHLSHAATAFYSSEFEEAGILVIDAVGEESTTSIYKADALGIQLLQSQHFPNSLGLLYSACTYFLGFVVNSDEYKVMGLAPYGRIDAPETQHFLDIIKNQLVDIREDGSIRLNEHYFSFMYTDRMVNDKQWEQLFGFPRRKANEALQPCHQNFAYAIQHVTEDILLRLAKTVRNKTGSRNLCLSGGCAMNCVANGILLKSGIFDCIHIPFAPDDSGTAIGAALTISNLYGERLINSNNTSYLGPAFSEKEILETLQATKIPYLYLNDKELFECVAHLLEMGCIVGWFQGRMEFGARALGNRSILAAADNVTMKVRINASVKFREPFRPFAPVVLKEYADEIFHCRNCDNAHMSFAYDVKTNRYPAITHVDGTARAQILEAKENPRLHNLLSSYYSLTGNPLLLNTSFNIMGEPIVCTPFDALQTFLKSGLDVLVMGNYFIEKE